MGIPKAMPKGTRCGKDGHVEVIGPAVIQDRACYFRVRCRRCGVEWEARGTDLRRGRGCKCYPHASASKGTLYMAVTADRYELPLAVADSPRELAKIVGIPAKTINEMICKGYNGGKSKLGMRFFRVAKEG